MKKGIFIQADQKQFLGAQVAKYALETRGRAREHKIPVTIMQVEDMPTYTAYEGMQYKRGTETRTHDRHDLQFFTLSRFMPPELMNFEGRALVIDPDIFALTDIGPLIDIDLQNNTVAACKERDWYDTSVMVLDCPKLTHWKIKDILEGLKNGTEDYQTWMRLKNEQVLEIPRTWNSIDLLTPETKMLHTSKRLTQPWKSGLPIDFTPGTVPKLFGTIPRFWVQRETHYQKHPDKNIENLFITLTREALAGGSITPQDITEALQNGSVRSDLGTLVGMQ